MAVLVAPHHALALAVVFVHLRVRWQPVAVWWICLGLGFIFSVVVDGQEGMDNFELNLFADCKSLSPIARRGNKKHNSPDLA